MTKMNCMACVTLSVMVVMMLFSQFANLNLN
jgi:hypothetical protein